MCVVCESLSVSTSSGDSGHGWEDLNVLSKILAEWDFWAYFPFMNAEQIVVEASKLAPEDQASVASRILRGLDSPAHHVSDEEVENRIREAKEDPSVLISFDDFVSGIQKRES